MMFRRVLFGRSAVAPSQGRRLTLVRAQARWMVHVHEAALLPAKVHAAIMTVALMVSTSAHAAGVTGFLKGWGDAANEVIRLTLLVGMMAGICFALYGIFNLAKKGMNRGDDITWGQVLWPVGGGALATIVLYVIQAVVEESGASRSDMGRQL